MIRNPDLEELLRENCPSIGTLMSELDEARAGGDRFEILSAAIRLYQREAGYLRFSVEVFEHSVRRTEHTAEQRERLQGKLKAERRELRDTELHIADLEARRTAYLDELIAARRKRPTQVGLFGPPS